MPQTKDQSQFIVNDQALPVLGAPARTELDSLLAKIQLNLDSPMRLRAGFPTADSKLYINSNVTTHADGTKKTTPPLKSTIPSFPNTTIDFQTGVATGGGSVDVPFPTTTVGRFRRLGLTLLPDGTLKGLFSDETTTQAALANPGSVFIKSGVPIGYIDLQATGATAFKTAGSASNVIENAAIFLFGSGGGGGGSGSGDSSTIEDEIKNRLRDSRFLWATPNVFSKHESTRVHSSSTAQSQITEDNLYLFSTPGKNVISTQSFDAAFLATDLDAPHAEVMAFWDASAVDTAATYFVSRDGGVNYQQMSVARVGASNLFRGYHVFTDEVILTSIDSQTVSAGYVPFDNTNFRRAQTLTLASKSKVRKISFLMEKIGTPKGNLFARIVRDVNGEPSLDRADILWESTPISVESLPSGINSFSVLPSKALPAGTYWMMMESDAAYRSTYVASTHLAQMRSGDSPKPNHKFSGAAGTWSTGTADLYYVIEGSVYDLRIRITSSDGGKKLLGYGLFYGNEGLSVPQGNSQLQTFVFSGDVDKQTFDITNFLPDPDRLKVYDVESGQVWRYPKFGLDGRQVVFAQGSFFEPGKQLSLVFDQSEGAGFDNSDSNAALLAANRLGSTNATLDRSAAGEGVLLRSTNGDLCEVWLEWNGTSHDIKISKVN